MGQSMMEQSIVGSQTDITEKNPENKSWRKSKLNFALRRPIIVGTIAVAMLLYAFWDQKGSEVIVISLAETYISVTAFVAATLILFLSIERLLGFNATQFMEENKNWELPMAAFLGALPGCGGALVVVTHYVNGRLSFGALIAVLTATMGDAAFLILAKEPQTGLILIASTFFIGWLSGILVNAVHGKDFMRKKDAQGNVIKSYDAQGGHPGEHGLQMLFANRTWRRWIDATWMLILVPGIVCAFLYAFQVNVLAFNLWGVPLSYVFALFAVICILSWVLFSGPTGRETCTRDSQNLTWRSVIDDTNFVTAWVMAAFLIFNMTIHVLEIDLQSLFGAAYIFLPLIAIVIGFIPGCGPQILVAATYLSGLVPFSALIGNAISNDGDALFPALALAPKAAIVATVYSAVPALIVSYSLLLLGH